MTRSLFAVLASLAVAPLLTQAAVPLWGQCGGNNHTGETECVSGAVCTYSNEWYSQCIPGSGSGGTTTTKTSSTKTSSTKTSSTKTSSTKTSTKTTSTTGGTGPAPSGITTKIPASAGYTALASPRTISGSFDGGMVKFDRKGSDGECQGQNETGENEAVFILAAGATIKNVIIGAAQAEGIHCRGTCTIENVWWEEVCEDAATFKQTGSGDVSYVNGGGAFGASDKVFQHNGAGTVRISNFYANNFGKLYRSCGNCSTSYKRSVVLDNVALIGGKEGVGINTNFGDTAQISRVCTNGKPSSANVCCRYKGVSAGSEPSKIGCGPSSECSQYTVSTC